MRTLFDQLAKRILTEALSRTGVVHTDGEVTPEVQRVDLIYVPDPALSSARSELGILGAMTGSPCLIEAFHQAPPVGEILLCILKQLTLFAEDRAKARRDGARLPRLPRTLWIIAAGRPAGALRRLGMTALPFWPNGFYSGVPGHRVNVVVVNELPRTRATLLLRLMGRSQVLADAIDELRTLSRDAWEQEIAMPVLVQLRLTIQADPALLSGAEQELLMTGMELYEAWKKRVHGEGLIEGREEGRQEGRQEGLVSGRDEGLRVAIRHVYTARFGEFPAALEAVLCSTQDSAMLIRWAELVGTQSRDELERLLLRS